MTLTTERQQFAEQNEMSMDFVNWFFDEKKEGCGNAWFIMAAAMWEGWKVRANREAQPVQSLELAGWQFKSVNGVWLGLIDEHGKNQAVREGCEVRGVYAMADALNDRDAVREAHAEWSRSTFGNVGPIGPLKHLSKEALEAAAQPDDLSEWADMQFLLWDAQRRAGITDEQITQAMIEKLSVNKKREWPEPKDGEPRLHITAPPAPAVPSKATPGNIEILASGYSNGTFQLDDDEANLATEIWNACRAAMLAQPVSQRYTFNSPVIPDGWIACSERMPELDKRVLLYFGSYDGHIEDGCIGDDGDGPYHYFFDGDSLQQEPTHWMPLPVAPEGGNG